MRGCERHDRPAGGLVWGGCRYCNVAAQRTGNVLHLQPHRYSAVGGDNTANRTYPWNGIGAYPPQSTIDAIDARQKLTCDAMKAAGITIYTIQVNTDGTANSPVMSYCASGSSNFFSTTTSSGIATAFNSIATSLSKLRLAR